MSKKKEQAKKGKESINPAQPETEVKAKVFIATPAGGGKVDSVFMKPMMWATKILPDNKIDFIFETLDTESLITRARNTMMAWFMATDCTHLLFIDSDIAFHPDTIVQLVLADKDMIGAVCPLKVYDFDRMHKIAREQPEMATKDILFSGTNYAINLKNSDQLEVDKGIVEVTDVGSAFMCIKREVVEKMIDKYPEKQYENNVNGYDRTGTDDFFYNFFDAPVQTVGGTRTLLSEDYAFCRYWKDLGGKIHVLVGATLTHIGRMPFAGNFFEHLKSTGAIDPTQLQEQLNEVESDNSDEDRG